jgi:hypothetical protein
MAWRWRFRGGIAIFAFSGRVHTLLSMAGNGGQMGVAKKKLAAESLSPTKGKSKATGKKTSGRGASKLSEAADKTLEENSDKIAKSLLESTLKGNIHSARLLVTLAEVKGENENAGRKRRVRSKATKLAAEPQWRGDETDAEPETSSISQLVDERTE